MIRNIGRLSRSVRLGAGAALLLAGMTGALAAQQVELVSRVHASQFSDTGSGAERFLNSIQSSYLPQPPSISADGRYVVFVSRATNLLPDQKDVNGGPEDSGRDVFLKDLAAGTLTLVSHSMSSPATTGNLGSDRAVISADGRYVAFAGRATDLVPGQTGDFYYGDDEDFLIYDRVTGTLTLAAQSSSHLYGSSSFTDFAMSADGRYTAFASDAPGLVPGQGGSGRTNVYLYDRVEKTIRLVSHTSASLTTAAGGRSDRPSISADGRFVVFNSNSADLVPPGQPLPSNGNLFLYDRTTEAVSLIGPGEAATISGDGKYIAFSTGSFVYLYDRDTRQVTLLSDSAGRPTISADGRYVAFLRGSSHQVTLVLYDRVSGTSMTASHPQNPSGTIEEVDRLEISADGRYVAFASLDPARVPGQADTNFSWDVFLFDRNSGTTKLVSSSSASAVTAGNSASYAPAISADGSRVAFFSLATDLVAGLRDLNQGQDLFAYDIATASNTAVTTRAPSLPSLSPAAISAAGALSADGRYVAFESDSPYLISGQVDSNQTTDVFLYDRITKTTILVSRTRVSAVTTARGRSVHPVISADGRFIVFASNAPDLAPGADDPERGYDIFLFDRTTGATTLVGRTRTSDPETSSSVPFSQYQISQDGRWVAFTSVMTDLVPGQQEEDPDGFFLTSDVFLWDRTTGRTTLVSHSSRGTTLAGNAQSSSPLLSSDGRYVAFGSRATDLVPGQIDESNRADLFLYDRVTGRTALVTHAAGSTVTAMGGGAAAMSADGRFIVFTNSTGGLDPSAPAGTAEGLYLYDRSLGTSRWIAWVGFFVQPRISADGKYVAFLSSQELVPGFYPGTYQQLYLYDRLSKSISLVTRPSTPNGRASSGHHENAVLSTDGRYVAFASNAGDLVPGQVSAPGRDKEDIFLFDRVSGTTTLVSRLKNSPVTAAGRSENPLISSSGRQVAFTSGVDLVHGDLNLQPDAYLFDLDAAPPGPGPGPSAPCTLLDTRRAADAPALRSDVRRVITAHGTCGVPATAKKVAVKVTALQPSGKGNLRFYSGNAPSSAKPSATLRFQKGQTRAASYTLPLATNGAGTLAIVPFVAGKGTVHVTVEVTGYE